MTLSWDDFTVVTSLPHIFEEGEECPISSSRHCLNIAEERINHLTSEQLSEVATKNELRDAILKTLKTGNDINFIVVRDRIRGAAQLVIKMWENRPEDDNIEFNRIGSRFVIMTHDPNSVDPTSLGLAVKLLSDVQLFDTPVSEEEYLKTL